MSAHVKNQDQKFHSKELMKLHRVYTSWKGVKTRVGIPDLVLVMYFTFEKPERNRLRRFYSSVEEFDRRVTKDDFT